VTASFGSHVDRYVLDARDSPRHGRSRPRADAWRKAANPSVMRPGRWDGGHSPWPSVFHRHMAGERHQLL